MSLPTSSGQVQTVAVIGAGPRGRHFAARALSAGCRVVVEDVLSSKLRQAVVELGPAESGGSFQIASSVEEAVRQADLAIDFVPDELESKLEIFSLLDRMAPPHTILCTPTHLSIADLASCTYRPERCLGLRNFDEAADRQCALVTTPSTSPDVTSKVERWLRQIGLSVSILPDTQESLLLPR